MPGHSTMLRVNLDAGGHDGLEHVHAALGVAGPSCGDGCRGVTAWTDTFMGLILR